MDRRPTRARPECSATSRRPNKPGTSFPEHHAPIVVTTLIILLLAAAWLVALLLVVALARAAARGDADMARVSQEEDTREEENPSRPDELRSAP
jgi:hypothetical protein